MWQCHTGLLYQQQSLEETHILVHLCIDSEFHHTQKKIKLIIIQLQIFSNGGVDMKSQTCPAVWQYAFHPKQHPIHSMEANFYHIRKKSCFFDI